MKLISLPAAYSSVFGPNMFDFEEVPTDAPAEVTFVDDEGALLGAKRYVGSPAISCSVESYLRRTLHPVPLLADRYMFTEATGRNVRLQALWGEEQASPLVTFTLAHQNLAEREPIGEATQRRTIARGEWDEVLFVASREQPLGAKVTFSTGEKFDSYSKSSMRDGLWAFVVNVDALLARTARPEQVEWFSVELVVEQEHIVKVTYNLVERAMGMKRLAWLGSDGQIYYYNFRQPVESSVVAQTTSVELASGTSVVAKSGWHQMRLESGVVGSEVAQHLAGIATSPYLWLVEGDKATPLVALSCEAHLAGSQGRGVSLVVRPAEKEVYW